MMAPANRRLGWIVLFLFVAAVLVIALIPMLTAWDLRPGTPLGQTIGISAALLLLATLRYPVVRRGDRPRSDKPKAHSVHAVVGSIGVSLALVHSQASLRQWSALVLLAALGLLATGLYGRLVSPRRVAGRFGADGSPYLPSTSPNPWTEVEARRRLNEKTRILERIGARSGEGQFVLRLNHWLRHPRLALSYAMLAKWERSLHARQPESATGYIPLVDRLWRRSHLVLAGLFVIGLAAHLVTVLFFAGYVADGREIYWWYFTE